ncbi:MAG: acyltransferase [Solobacterium sp.]|nr:acyltransferase [Solobacterium sp.]
MTAVLNSLIAMIPFVLLLFPAERTAGSFDPADRNVTNRCRGFFALVVILHHMAQRCSDRGLLIMYYDIGYLPVAMFFFYTGYGLLKKGIGQKQNYFRRRLPSVAIPYIQTMVIYWILYALAGDVKSPASLMLEHLNNASGISFLWYVFVYVFWILFLGAGLKFMKKDVQILFAAGLFACLFVTLFVMTAPGLFWIYDTVLMIPLGCAWAYREQEITGMIRRHYSAVLSVSFLLFVLSLIRPAGMVIRIIGYSFSAVMFMIFLNTALMKQRPCGKAISFLGTVSYEIYLLHGIPVTFLRSVIASEALWTLSVLVIAVLSAWCLHEVNLRTWNKKR